MSNDAWLTVWVNPRCRAVLDEALKHTPGVYIVQSVGSMFQFTGPAGGLSTLLKQLKAGGVFEETCKS